MARTERLRIGPITISTGAAGLLTFSVDGAELHLGVVSPGNWEWGRATEEYDRCLEYFGLGPLLLVSWLPYSLWDRNRELREALDAAKCRADRLEARRDFFQKLASVRWDEIGELSDRLEDANRDIAKLRAELVEAVEEGQTLRIQKNGLIDRCREMAEGIKVRGEELSLLKADLLSANQTINAQSHELERRRVELERLRVRHEWRKN